MDPRVRTLAVRAVLGLAVIAVGCLPVRARAGSLAESASQAGKSAHDEVAVTWVFGLDEYMSCEPPSSVIRKLQRDLGERVEISALYVGRDLSRAESILREERLQVPVRRLSESEFREQYQGRELPLVVASQGGQRMILEKQAWRYDSKRPVTELESVVTRMSRTQAASR